MLASGSQILRLGENHAIMVKNAYLQCLDQGFFDPWFFTRLPRRLMSWLYQELPKKE